MGNLDIRELSVQALAYLGDAVWSLKLREYFVEMNLKVNELNKLTNEFASAKGQNIIYNDFKLSLNEKELAIAKRARNGKMNSYTKNYSVNEYRNATALEAIIGYYHYTNQEEKIDAILEKYVIEGGDNESKKEV